MTATCYFTDHSGDQPYGEFQFGYDYQQSEVSTEVTESRQYLSGMGVQASSQPSSAPAAQYYHGDLIRSTVLLTDAAGAPSTQPAPESQPFAGSDVWKFAYSAFGETVGDSGLAPPATNQPTRYAYAGGWGYEAGHITLGGANPDLGALELHHVGARWYQPDVGRFVQRDPIGLRGGLNAYAYCRNNPLSSVDPLGLWDWWEALGGVIGGAVGGAIIGGGFGLVGGGGIFSIPGAIIGGIVGGIVGGIAGGYYENAIAGTIMGSVGGGFAGALGVAIFCAAPAAGVVRPWLEVTPDPEAPVGLENGPTGWPSTWRHPGTVRFGREVRGTDDLTSIFGVSQRVEWY